MNKIIDLLYTVKYSLLNVLDTIKFGVEDIVYYVKSKFEKPEDFILDQEPEEVKPVKKKKKTSKKKKK